LPAAAKFHGLQQDDSLREAATIEIRGESEGRFEMEVADVERSQT